MDIKTERNQIMNKTNCACKCEHCGSTLEVKKEKVNPWGLCMGESQRGENDQMFLLESNGEIKAYHSVFTPCLGNTFLTKESAEDEFKRRAALYRIRKYIYDNYMGFEPDWKNLDQWKYSVNYSHKTHGFWLTFDTWSNPGKAFYLATEEHANQVIKDCEADLKILFGVEE